MDLLNEIADSSLKSRAAKIKKYCSRELEFINTQGLFRFYNRHGPSHSQKVWGIIKKILESWNGVFSEYELFLEEAAAWCHDLGMIKREGENFEDPKVCEEVRKTHHERVVEYISEHWKELGFCSKPEALLLANICWAHSSKVKLSDLEKKERILVGEKVEEVRTRFLGAILRLADALDAGKERLPPESYRDHPEIPESQHKEYWKHEVVDSVKIKDGNIILQMSVEYEYPEDIVEEVKKKLNDELDSVKGVLSENTLDLKLKFLPPIKSLVKRKISKRELGVPSYEGKKPLGDEKVKPSVHAFLIDNNTKLARYRKFLEDFMREFISEKLEERYGGEWWEEKVPSGVREKCANRKKERIKEGRATEVDPLIDFADIPDYLEIFLFKGNWKDVFGKYYGESKEAKYVIKNKFSELYPIRTDEAHSREISDEDIQTFEKNARDLLCFDRDKNAFRGLIKEFLGKRLLPPPEFDKTALYEIKNLDAFYKVVRDSNFLENKEEDFKAKKKNVFYFGDKQTVDRRLKNIIDKLGSQKILFITGPPAAGKSTFLLFFLDECLKEGIGEWQTVFFLNPHADKLKKSLEIIDGIIEKSNNISPEDVLLVIDSLHRKEDEETYIDKCSELFTKILEDKYSLIVTIRDSELAILKETLGDRWTEFENIVEIEPVDPEKDRIKRIFVNYLNYYKDRIKLQNMDLSFEDINKHVQGAEAVPPEKKESYQELDKSIQGVIGKSGGVPGYVKYLMEDISRKGKLSTEIIEKYPPGMTNFTRKIIKRDYVIGDDKVLPLLILFLAKIKGHALTWEFINSFIEWGVDEIDKNHFDKEEISKRARNLVNYYTADIHDGNITLYYLISHWREGIEDFLKQREAWEFREIESELDFWIEKYLTQKQEELRRGKLPDIPKTWLVVADVTILCERKNMGVLEDATRFLNEYGKETKHCAFLKKTISSLWREKIDEELSAEDYENAVVSLENAIAVDSTDASLHSLASDCYYKKRDLSKAVEYSLRAVKLKPAESTYLGKCGRFLESSGIDLERKGDYSEAIYTFGEAIKSYEGALKIINGMTEWEKGRRKREKSLYCWRIGYCNKRAELMRMGLQSEDEGYLRRKAEECFKNGKNYETKGDYDTALKMFEHAKESVLKCIEIKDVLEEDMHNLVNNIYKRISVCYEKKRDYKKAAEYYSIHADLNEYTPNSGKIYMTYGNKFMGWRLYDKAASCFRKALRADQNDYQILSELADVNAKLGKLDEAVKYTKKSLEMQKLTMGFLTESDEDITSGYEYRLKIRDDSIGTKLSSICSVVNLAIDEEERELLADALYEAGMSLGQIKPENIVDPWEKDNRSEIEKIRNKIMDIKISCLCRAHLIDRNNDRIMNILEKLTDRPIEEIRMEYRTYYQHDLKGEIENPVDAICRIHSTAISTMIKLNEVRRKGIRRKIKNAKSKYSGYWGWMGGRISRIYRDDQYVNKLSPNIGVKCFELSLKLRERNKKSSNGLGWALFYAGRHEDAIRAFKDDLREDMNPNNPYAITGIGRAYEEKGDYNGAEEYLKEGAKLRFELRHDDEPQKVINDLKKSAGRLGNLASLCDARNDQMRLLREALEMYEMIGEIAQEIKLEDEQLREAKLIEDNQNLFRLEAMNLGRYIKEMQTGAAF